MPPTRRSQLGAEELAALAAAVSAGRRRTVYLRAAVPSLGLEAGTSARVAAVEGTTVTVRPRGVPDDVPFDASELAPTAAAAALPAEQPPAGKPPAAGRVAPARRRSVQVTLSGSAQDGWTVQVGSGSRRPIPVPAENVARAVAALDEPHTSHAVGAVLAHARTEAARQVDELSARLAQARATLRALGVDAPERT